MSREGCLRFEDERFPECEDKFNKNCLKCQFNNSYMKDDGDIDNFNRVFFKEFE